MTLLTKIWDRKGLRVALMVAAAIVIAVIALLPPAPIQTAAFTGGPPTARGAYHIHSDRSDGSGSLEEIAQAAQRAGLQFIIVTDHGDGTREPEVPQYRHGVLVIDAVELNTTGGHMVALGLPATPYPLAGTAADVLEDVHRLQGFGIAAHPDSARAALSWQAWDANVDGIEWLNGDSSWRDEGSGSLARAVLGYGFRAPGALASLLDRPDDLLARWDALGATRSVPVLAAADAHARLGADEPGPSAVHLALPAYEAAFRAFSNHVVLKEPLTGNAVADASEVLTSVRQGRLFTVVEAIASPGGLVFTAHAEGRVAQMGEEIGMDAGVMLRARIGGAPGTSLRLLRNGVVVHQTGDAELSWSATEAGVYRVEAHATSAPGTSPVPWILSNPIYVGVSRPPTIIGSHLAEAVSRIPARTAEAATEHGAADVSELVEVKIEDERSRRLAGELPIGWRFALSPGVPAGQFAAVRVPANGGLAAFERVRFTVTSPAPLRAWLQVRGGPGAQRWGMTFYADREARIVELPLKQFLPIGQTATVMPPLEQIDALLFVVDTLNSKPGASGSMTISEVAFVR